MGSGTNNRVRPRSGLVLAGAGDIETKDPETDSHQPRAGEVLASLMQSQHEGRPRDNPTIAKESGASGRQSHHKNPTMRIPTPPPKPEPCRLQKDYKVIPERSVGVVAIADLILRRRPRGISNA